MSAPPGWILALLLAFPAAAWGGFLDSSGSARGRAMGGNLVACPMESDSAVYNPAGWGLLKLDLVSARYESLFTGLDTDSLSQSGLAVALPLGAWGGGAVSWEHMGADRLSQDRVKAGWGRSLAASGALAAVQAGLDVSYLGQAFNLDAPLAGLGAGRAASQAFSLGGGILVSPAASLSLGASVEDANQPNLGIAGSDRLDPCLRWGLGWHPDIFGLRGLELSLAQSLSGPVLQAQAGLEWTFAPWGAAFRAGANAQAGSLGFGWHGPWLSIDYAYSFSLGEAASLSGEGLPGSHLLELAAHWGKAAQPDPADAFIAKARESFARQDWQSAYWYFQQARKLKAGDQSLAREGEAALGKFNQQRAKAYQAQGREAENQDLLIEAKRYYEWASSLDPQNAQYRGSLALLAERISSRKAAEAAPAARGAMADPKVVSLAGQSAGLAKRGKFSQARQVMRRALALYPQDKVLGYFMAILESGSPVPEDPQVQRLVSEAEIYEKKGRMDLARQAWMEVLQRQPDHAQAIGKISGAGAARPALKPGEAARAEKLYENGLKAYLNGDVAGAIAMWEQVLKIDPGHVNALNNLTRARLELKEAKP